MKATDQQIKSIKNLMGFELSKFKIDPDSYEGEILIDQMIGDTHIHCQFHIEHNTTEEGDDYNYQISSETTITRIELNTDVDFGFYPIVFGECILSKSQKQELLTFIEIK